MKIRIEVNGPDLGGEVGLYEIRTIVYDEKRRWGKRDVSSETLIHYHGDRNAMIMEAMQHTAKAFVKELTERPDNPTPNQKEN